MPLSALTGTRLRERRLARGLRQADVAVAAGISASYLNLIEHNRRKVTPEVADRLADALGLDRAALAGGGAAALIEGLRSAAGGRIRSRPSWTGWRSLSGVFPAGRAWWPTLTGGCRGWSGRLRR
jgi:transcriptional regulator with XRE-family HTH domain